MLGQDKNFFLISLNILITCLLDNEWILYGELTCQSRLGIKVLNKAQTWTLPVMCSYMSTVLTTCHTERGSMNLGRKSLSGRVA